MIEYLNHKFISCPDQKRDLNLKYHKCDICDRKAFLYVDGDEWYYWKHYSNFKNGINIVTQEKLILSCEEDQIKRMIE